MQNVQAVGLSTMADILKCSYMYLYDAAITGRLETIEILIGKRRFRVVTPEAVEVWLSARKRKGKIDIALVRGMINPLADVV